MKRISVLLCIWSAVLVGLMAQNIAFSTSKPKKAYTFTVHNGLKMDTISRGITSDEGEGEIRIPTKYESIPLMGIFSLDGEQGKAMIVNGEDFYFMLNPEGNVFFKNSIENEFLFSKSEEALLEKNKNTYVYSYLKAQSVVMQMAEVIALKHRGRPNLFKEGMARAAALKDLDVDKLYYSNFWYYAIDGLMKLSVGESGFANDMNRLLDKVKSDRVYIAFVEDLITITNQFGMDDAFDIIVSHVQEQGRIKYPQGAIYDAFAMAKIKPGIIAPSLKGLSPSLGKTVDNYTLLLFYQPGCNNCHTQLDQLKDNYSFYKSKGVRIVTVSGTDNEKDFRNEVKSFLWKDVLCDYKSYAGENFQTYGVVSTPMIYLLDSKGIVLKRFALVKEVENFIRGRA